MAAVLASLLFSPFLYGLEFFLASTLSTQIAISVATVVVSTVTILYYQRALYRWYEDTTEFIVRLKNKFKTGGHRKVTFTASARLEGEVENTNESNEPETSELLGNLNEPENIGEEYASKFIPISNVSKDTTEKPQQLLQTWMEKQTVAMHRSHWVAKPGKIAPSAFHGYSLDLGVRRASADTTPEYTALKDANTQEEAIDDTNVSYTSEQRLKTTLDRRQSSPSSLCQPLTVQPIDEGNTVFSSIQPDYSGNKTQDGSLQDESKQGETSCTNAEDLPGIRTEPSEIEVLPETEVRPPKTQELFAAQQGPSLLSVRPQKSEELDVPQPVVRAMEVNTETDISLLKHDDQKEGDSIEVPTFPRVESHCRPTDRDENTSMTESLSETPVVGFYRPSIEPVPAQAISSAENESLFLPGTEEEESSGYEDQEGEEEDPEDMPQAMLIPIETEVREAVLVESSSISDNDLPLRANMQPVPLESDESEHASHTSNASHTSDDRSSGQTDTDSLATDDIFDSDSELDDSGKRSLNDNVFLEEPAPVYQVPSVEEAESDHKGDNEKRDKPNNWSTHSGLVVVCELVETDSNSRPSETLEADPDSSLSLTVNKGPIPRKDSFGLAPFPKFKAPNSKTEKTTYSGPIAKISVEEVKSDTDSEVAGILSKESVKIKPVLKKVARPLIIDAIIKIENPGKDPDITKSSTVRQDSLGIPPVVVGEVSFPRPSVQRSIPLIPVPVHPSIVLQPGTDEESEGKSETRDAGVQRIDSLDVPPFFTGKDHFPPLPSKFYEQQASNPTKDVEVIKVHLPPKKLLKRGRPRSLDIPNLNLSESCPPRQVRRSPDDSSSSSGSASASPKPAAKRKQGASILKRNGSVEKSGPKKSVTFSPIVIPWGGPSQERIEPLAGIRRQRRYNDMENYRATRPKIFRNNSVDIPDTVHLREQADFKREADFQRNSGSRDQVIRAQNLATKSNLAFVRIRDENFRKPIDLGPPEDNAKRKSAKERFLEAGGARAVMSAFVTQDSTERHPCTSASTSLEQSDGEDKDSPTDKDQESTNRLQQVLLAPVAQDDGGAKSRFLDSADEGNIRASRFFVDRVKGSVESDYSEPHSEQNSPDPTDETSSSSDPQFEETEEGGIRNTTAKSRFFLSCRDSNPPGFLGDRHSGNWEPISPTLPEVPEADETQEELRDNCGPFLGLSRQEGRVIYTPASGVDRSHLYDDEPSTSNEDGLDSPGSSGVHSMDPDEPVAQRLLEVEEADDTADFTTRNAVYESLGATSYAHQHCKVPIVLDNGSQFLKVGLCNEDKPGIEIHNVIEMEKDDTARSRFVGLDAVRHCHMSPFDFPIRAGVIENWQDMEAIWHYVFDSKLGLTPQEHPLLLTEIASVSKSQREKTFEILFETFNVPSLYIVNQALSSLKAIGNKTGLVLSSGSGITEVVPIFDGVPISRAITTLDLGGRSVTYHLARLVELETGHHITSSPGALEVFRELKEDQTFVSKDYAAEHPESNSTLPWECWLPDGCTVEVSRHHVQSCAEPLFQPSLAGILHQPGLPQLVADCLDRCEQDYVSDFPSSLVLSGGNTYLGGFTERLQTELNTLGLGDITVDARKDRDLLPWCGGAILARELSEGNSWVALDEYVEHGAAIVHQRCL